MPILGVIFDLGSTLINRTGLELEKEKCGTLAEAAALRSGRVDRQRLAARLLEIRLDAWRRSDEELVEHPATGSIAQAFTEAGLPTGGEILLKAEAVFFEPEVRASRLYPGATGALETLRAMGLRVGMISNATSHDLILDITTKLGIKEHFDPLVTSAGFGRIKPHPAIFTHVLDAWGVAGRAAVMVGDTLRADIQGAHGVGMRSILVDIEPNPANARFDGPATPTARVTALAEVPGLIRRWAAA